jgi:hypothetical protein
MFVKHLENCFFSILFLIRSSEHIIQLNTKHLVYNGCVKFGEMDGVTSCKHCSTYPKLVGKIYLTGQPKFFGHLTGSKIFLVWPNGCKLFSWQLKQHRCSYNTSSSTLSITEWTTTACRSEWSLYGKINQKGA